jgi:hypothetical protein
MMRASKITQKEVDTAKKHTIWWARAKKRTPKRMYRARKLIIWRVRAKKRTQKKKIGPESALSDGWGLESTLERKEIELKSALFYG